MAAILRIKRKNTELHVPLDTLVVACKRSKTEASLSDISPVETVVQFAGTLTDPTEDVTKHVAKLLDTEEHKTGVKRMLDSSPSNISAKIRRVDERYKVTDCQSLDTFNETELKDKSMMLIDVEDSWSISLPTYQNGVEQEDIEDYVYDLYYAQTSNDIWFESDNISVHRIDYPNEDFEDEDESSDSNAESYYKNDYPDTDPDRSSESSFNGDYFDMSIDENDFIDNRNVDEWGEYIHKRKHKLDSSSNSDLWEESLSDKEEIVGEISCDEEISDDEKNENVIT